LDCLKRGNRINSEGLNRVLARRADADTRHGTGGDGTSSEVIDRLQFIATENTLQTKRGERIVTQALAEKAPPVAQLLTVSEVARISTSQPPHDLTQVETKAAFSPLDSLKNQAHRLLASGTLTKLSTETSGGHPAVE
jgi:hypothetical protein